jgi:filamentous hemagglutinin family protein
MRFLRHGFWWFCLNAIGLYAILFSIVQADIVTDGTVGPAQTLTGPAFVIPEDLGSRAGENLFHSFHTFDINAGEQVTFTGSSSIANVISRVTGGQQSSINGLLRSTVGQADFYLINPAGIVMGANAQIDVPASFYVSTADQLNFPDGSVVS